MRNLRHQSTRRGFALLLVLIIVSFAAAIAVLFLLSAKQERSGTDSYAQGSRVRQLADTAVNIVMGQINTATREGTGANPISWASQPGMIRTYNSNGNLSNAYKLYSWNHMIEGATAGVASDPSAPVFNPVATNASEFPPTTSTGTPWYNLPSQYTDLNAPVTTSNPAGGTVQVYPIMDPTIANMTSGGAVTSTGSVTWDFPKELAIAQDGAGYAPPTATTNTLPMPVQWLYVLQDGTWIFPNGVNGNKVTFDPTAVTSTNPIVGRVAFWTDDETCKVNLNTAGEGAYWDWPKCASQDDVQFAGNPPAKNEFYRFSGHPASTSLSAIFPELMGGAAGFPRWNYSSAMTTPNSSANPTYIQGLESMLSGDVSALNAVGPYSCGLSPRYSYGHAGAAPALTGSRGGTYPAPYYQIYDPLSTVTGGTFIDTTAYQSYSNYSPVPLNSYRLYATPDELFFASDQPAGARGRAGNTPAPGTATAGGYENRSLYYNFTNNVPMTPLQLAQRDFLMTTTSKAPETTLFNTPRVSMWPITWPYPNSYYLSDSSAPGAVNGRGAVPAAPAINPNSNTLKTLATTSYGAGSTKLWITPQENLLAFCSTLNSKATGTPATGNAPLPYYFQRQVLDSPTSDWSNITRNQQLANYIRGMIHNNVPGFGSSLENKWTASNADWITLECMDYCRSQIAQVTYDPNDPNGALMYSFTGAATSNPGASVERNSYTSPPLRITAPMLASIPNSNFNGTPIAGNAKSAGQSDAYVTQGSFPSLKEAALLFYATGRVLPSYRGALPGAIVSGTAAPSMVADPFYWANLINPGPLYGGIQSTTMIPDGLTTGSSAAMETVDAYPVGNQTIQMQAVMLFDFSQLRDGINVPMSPNFWIRVDKGNLLTAQTGDISTVGGQALFPSTTSVEYRARNGGGGTVFASFRGKTSFAPGVWPNTAGQTNWTLSSAQILVSPSDVNFTFTGTTITVSLYAAYPATKPDTDPTNDSTQFITSYVLPFGKWPSMQPVPIAPRWNSRQSPQVWYPQPNYVATTGTQYWHNAEFVPSIAPISSWGGPNVPPTFDVTNANVRDNYNAAKGYINPYPEPPAAAPTATMPYSLDGQNLAGTQWMMYATGYSWSVSSANGNSSGLPSIPLSTATSGGFFTNTAIPPVATGTPLTNTAGWSMNMVNRYNAMVDTNKTLGLASAEGTPAFTGSPNWIATNEAALFTTTTFISGSAGAQTNQPQGVQMITPYDTVISCLADPSYANIQGDPRLINNSGETMTFDTSQNVLSANAPKLDTAPAMILNNTVPLTTSAVGGSGFTAYPRATFQAQYHELSNHGYIGTLTGYHFSPMWVNNKVPTNLQNPRYKNVTGGSATSPSVSLFAMEGSSGGNGSQGLTQSLFNGIGLDTNAYMQMNPDWDWTSQEGSAADGGYIERPDQDYQTFYLNQTTNINLGTPYFSRSGIDNATAFATAGSSTVTMYSPNRQIPSPIQFGTLPSSMTQGWQTLVFSPNPASVMDDSANVSAPAVVNPGVAALTTPPTATGVPYTNGVPDHLLLDMFWMPVAEPYPISEQFSTSGKINLNYAMMPFPYIQRKTGLDAVLKSVWIYAIPDTVSGTIDIPHDYKAWYFMGNSSAPPAPNGRSKTNTRYPINVDATLNAFDYKFTNGDIFRSASQICDMFLYPNDPKYPNLPATANTLANGVTADLNGSITNISAWWQASGRLTSDNGREAPYNAIYSRITTQSNTYTVHWKVQALHQISVNGVINPQWTEGTDRVVSELRGSTLIERYIDPNAGSTAANSLPDYATAVNWQNLMSSGNGNPNPITYFYKWRIDNETYFQPGP